jgi:outer membrane protein TolC
VPGSAFSFKLWQRSCAAALSAVLAAAGLTPVAFAQAQSTTTAPPDAPAAAANPAPSLAQQAQLAQQQQSQPVAPQGPFHVELPHSHNPFAPYMPSSVPPTNLTNSPRLQNLERDGKLYISLKDAIALALENNLDIAYFRYTLPIADTDLARTKAGGVANGVNTSVQGGSGGFSASGSNGTGGAGNGTGAGAGGAGGLVQSTLGNGTAITAFDPQVYLQGFVDHTTQPLANTVLYGIPSLQTNTIEGITQYTEAFPLGTNISVVYEGQRLAQNSPDYTINPTLLSYFNVTINQPLLAGFGLGTNERFIHIAKKNRQLADLAFRAQVIATVTQVENIYWDLVNAYQDEQVKERSLGFANETLSDDQKQLQLQNIPAMQVMKDQSAVATSEGDLTVAKATLRLEELLIKNALTKTIDDPALADMPVVPLDRIGPPDDNAEKPIDQLIAEAEKNRPDVSMDEIAMQTAQISLQAIKNELLPSLTLYGQYAGYGEGGPANGTCALGPACASTLPSGFGGALENSFNYTSPEYQVGFKLNITLRNRIAKADQFRAVLEYRQKELTFEEQKKSIRFDVRNSQYALEQARARVDAAQKSRDLMQRTFDIAKQEQKLGAMSSFEALSAEHELAVAESALVTAQTKFEEAKVDIDRATGETLDRLGVSIDDAKTGVVTHLQP